MTKEEKFMQLAEMAKTDESVMEIFQKFPMKFSILGLFRGRGLKSVLRIIILPIFVLGFSYTILTGQMKHTFGLPPMLVGIVLLIIGLFLLLYIFKQFFVPDLDKIDEIWETIHSKEISKESSNNTDFPDSATASPEI